MNNTDFISLIDRYLRGEASIQEEQQLLNFLESFQGQEVPAEFSNERAALEEKMWGRVSGAIEVSGRPAVHRVHFLKTAWFRVAVAIIILFGIGTYIFTHTSQPDKEVAFDQSSPKSNDIAPGYNRAMLTLSDGKKVALDSSAGKVISDKGVAIKNSEGQLRYSGGEVAAINTMTTPKGGQYQLTLADGTRVWLNAASSITYPTAFTGKTREVSATGEAYFEIKANKEKPFIVKTSKELITVLGTEFNVNTYEDEPYSKTSLISGAIKINDKILSPGQAYRDGKIINTNTSEDIAWKNGSFNIQGADIKTVMRTISRWYDVDIIYERDIPHQFYLEMNRRLPLSDVLKVLSATERVELEQRGRTVIVK